MEQNSKEGTAVVCRRDIKNDQQHSRSSKVLPSTLSDLRKTYTTEETVSCLLHQGRMHDFNMDTQMVSSHSSITVRLRFPCPHARRWGISMHHQLYGRLHRVNQASRSESEGDKRPRANATHRDTLKWHIEDDTGLVHVLVIQGAYLIPESATQILSPQHLAQQANDHYPKEEGTGALTTSKNITLFWSQRQFAKTVPHDPRTNVGLTTTNSGARSYHAFCTSILFEETNQTNIFTTHVIPDDEDDESFQPSDPVAPPAPEEDEPVASPEQSPEAPGQGPMTTHVDLSPISQLIPEDPEPTSLDPNDELLRWH